MNLCVECIHFRRVNRLDSKGNCTHPQAVISYSPIDGKATYTSAEEMRRKVSGCRISGVHFQPKPITETNSFVETLTRWFR